MRRARVLATTTVADVRESAYATASAALAGPPWAISGSVVAASWFRGVPNFGDAMAPVILRSKLGARVVWVRPSYRPKIVSIGSVLSYAREGDVVIGSGLIRPTPLVLPSNVTVLALRGPRTAELVGLANDENLLFGDPGMLIAEILGVSVPANLDGPVSVVPHYADLREVYRLHTDRWFPDDFRVVDVQGSVDAVVKEIAQSRCCISSSLHGLIVAESLGIPAIWVRMSDRITGGDFKFNDYFEGTGRAAGTPLTLSEARESALATLPRVRPDALQIRAAFERARALTRPKFEQGT